MSTSLYRLACILGVFSYQSFNPPPPPYLGLLTLYPFVFPRHTPQETRDIVPMLVYCWASVADGGSTINQHCDNISRDPPSPIEIAKTAVPTTRFVIVSIPAFRVTTPESFRARMEAKYKTQNEQNEKNSPSPLFTFNVIRVWVNSIGVAYSHIMYTVPQAVTGTFSAPGQLTTHSLDLYSLISPT